MGQTAPQLNRCVPHGCPGLVEQLLFTECVYHLPTNPHRDLLVPQINNPLEDHQRSDCNWRGRERAITDSCLVPQKNNSCRSQTRKDIFVCFVYCRSVSCLLLVAHVGDLQWGTQACWVCGSFFPVCCTARSCLFHSIQTVVCSIYTAWRLQNNILIMLILIIAVALFFLSFLFLVKCFGFYLLKASPPPFLALYKECADGVLCICSGACTTIHQGRGGKAEVCRLPPCLGTWAGEDVLDLGEKWKTPFKS